MNVADGDLRSQNKPPSDEGGGFAVGEDGGREAGSLPKKSLSLSHGLRRDNCLRQDESLAFAKIKCYADYRFAWEVFL